MRITTENIFIGCIVLLVSSLLILWVLLTYTVWANKKKENKLYQLEKQVTIGLAQSFKGPKKSKYPWISNYYESNEALWQFSTVLLKVVGLLHRAKSEAINSFSYHIGLSHIIEKKMNSKDWYTKAMAIRLSHELGLSQNLEKINSISKNTHILVQREKQIAQATFLGWQSLEFLTRIETPISQWQQICIIKKLQKDHPSVQKEFLEEALRQDNHNTTELLIRIIGSFKLTEYKYFIENQLHSKSRKISDCALKVLHTFETNSFETWVNLCQANKDPSLNTNIR